MASSTVCWGIELGAGAIKAIKLRREGDEVKVVDYAVIPHKKPLSTPELDINDAIRVALGQLVSQKDMTGAGIAISIPGHSGFARFAKLPPVEPKKIPDIVKFEAVQQIPFPIDQVEWDYQTFITKDSPDVEVGIFAVTRDKIVERLGTWNDVGVTPELVTLGPLAAFNAVSWDQDFGGSTPGTVILDIGTTSTDLIVFEPGRVWIRTFPVGGHQFTDALVNAFKLSYIKAEALKKQAEQSTHARQILQALRPVFTDLVGDVQRSIGYYQSSHKDANLTRLIGLGSTFNLPGLRKYLGQQLQMEVVRLEKFNKLSIEGPAGAEFEAATVNLATAYGLALQGLGFNPGITANLVPVKIVREQVWRKKTMWVAAAAGLSIAGGAASFLGPIIAKGSDPTSSKPAIIQQVSNKLGTLKSEWGKVQQGFVTDYKATNVASLVQHRDLHARLLQDLGVMLKSADDKAAADPKEGISGSFSVINYLTQYAGLAPASEGGAPAAGAGGSTQVGARVRNTLEIKSFRPEAEKFLVATIMKWLSENADREGVPYAFDSKLLKYEVLERREIPATKPAAGTAPGAGGTEGGNPSDAPPERPDERPSDDGGGVGGGGGGRFGGGGGGGGRLGGGGGGTMGGGGSGGGGESGGAGAPGGDLNVLAPLPAPAPEGKPGQTLWRFRVTYEAVIKDPAPKPDPAKDARPPAPGGAAPPKP